MELQLALPLPGEPGPGPKPKTPFTIPGIIQQLNHAGGSTTQDLGLLRQVSTTFNKLMSQTYFDKLDRTIYVDRWGGIGMILRENDKGCFCCRKPYITKDIDRKNWTPDLAPIFRTIDAKSKFLLSSGNKNRVSLMEMAPFLGPYITKLDLSSESWQWEARPSASPASVASSQPLELEDLKESDEDSNSPRSMLESEENSVGLGVQKEIQGTADAFEEDKEGNIDEVYALKLEPYKFDEPVQQNQDPDKINDTSSKSDSDSSNNGELGEDLGLAVQKELQSAEDAFEEDKEENIDDALKLEPYKFDEPLQQDQDPDKINDTSSKSDSDSSNNGEFGEDSDEEEDDIIDISKDEFHGRVTDFVSKLVNLREIIFHISCESSDLTYIDALVQSIKPSITIFFVGSFENAELAFLKDLVTNLKKFPNVLFEIDHGDLNSYEDLASVTEFILDNLDVIPKPSITIEFNNDGYPDNMEANVKKNLIKLSPHLCSLKYFKQDEDELSKMETGYRNLFDSIEFPKLKELDVSDYFGVCELLGNCPKLESLALSLDQDVCIFNNQQKTDEENVEEFISCIHMENLKTFKFWLLSNEKSGEANKILDENDLGIYFKSLIPKTVDFAFWGFGR